jgi:hypothetical protein
VGSVVAVLEEEELDLAADHRREPELGGGLDLALQDPPRRHFDRLARVDVDEVDEDDGGGLHPGQVADGRRVDHAAHVSVALVVAGPRETGDGCVVEVAGDQVVAVLRALLDYHVEIELPVRALSDEAAVVIAEGDDHRVDRAVADVGLELFGGDVPVLRHQLTPVLCRRQ